MILGEVFENMYRHVFGVQGLSTFLVFLKKINIRPFVNHFRSKFAPNLNFH